MDTQCSDSGFINLVLRRFWSSESVIDERNETVYLVCGAEHFINLLWLFHQHVCLCCVTLSTSWVLLFWQRAQRRLRQGQTTPFMLTRWSNLPGSGLALDGSWHLVKGQTTDISHVALGSWSYIHSHNNGYENTFKTVVEGKFTQVLYQKINPWWKLLIIIT